MLKQSSLKELQGKKNLLAFSAGVDSSALFFLLLQNSVAFDVAIVDYGVRQQSKEEVAYAQELASKYNLSCHLLNAPPIEKNFESKAREIRYDFFEKLIKERKYENLLTAHHLGDRFEWTLMQFCKGAGCAEIAGMSELQKRENYSLVRPLLHLDKPELIQYLNENSFKYFEDDSNLNQDIKRNEFRHKHSNPLLQKHLSGIKKSFEYIDEDVASLLEEMKILSINDFAYLSASQNARADIFNVDKYLKSKGYMMSASEKAALKSDSTTTVGRKFIINQTRKFIFIVPNLKEKIVLQKQFKEECRVLKIEPKLRTYLAKDAEAFSLIKRLLTSV